MKFCIYTGTKPEVTISNFVLKQAYTLPKGQWVAVDDRDQTLLHQMYTESERYWCENCRKYKDRDTYPIKTLEQVAREKGITEEEALKTYA